MAETQRFEGGRMNWTAADLKAITDRIGVKGRTVRLLDKPKEPKPAKYRSVKTEVEGIVFDSKLEALCWGGLRLSEKMGQIRNLRRQVRFSLFGFGGEHIGIYRADFVFEERRGEDWIRVVADTKSEHTKTLPEWARTKKLLMACHGIAVRELP